MNKNTIAILVIIAATLLIGAILVDSSYDFSNERLCWDGESRWPARVYHSSEIRCFMEDKRP